MLEFENLLMSDVIEPPLPFESCWDLVLSMDPGENGNLANFSTVEQVSLPDSLVGCPRLYDVVRESSRHHLENMQSMIKNKNELENTPGAQEEPCEEAATLCTFAGNWTPSTSSEGCCETPPRHLLR